MTSRKTAIDVIVRYIPKSENMKTVTAGLLPGEQNKNISQNNKKVPKLDRTSGFAVLK